MLKSKFSEDGTPVSQLTRGSERLVRLCCDMCGTISTVTWSNYQQSLRLHPERRGKTYCRLCGRKIGGVKLRGRKCPAVSKANAKRHGPAHASWRGGRYVDQHGYVMVHVKQGRGSSGWKKYKKEHVFVMEQHLGRSLTSREVVHHIDNDKQNNVLSNLYLTDHAGHRLAHVSLTLSYMLLRAAKLVGARTRATIVNSWAAYRSGKISFDATLGVYVANLKPRELLEHPSGRSRGQSAAEPFGNKRKVQRLGRTVQTGR